MTARTSKPNVSISADDLDALDTGRITMLDLATRERCTKQNISKRVRGMRAASSTGPGIPTGTTAAPITSTGPTLPAGSVLIDAHQAAVSVNLGILYRVGGLLEGPDALGPSAVKALAGAVASARAELALLGVLTTNDDENTPSEFVIRIMTDAEHEETKRRVELPDDYED